MQNACYFYHSYASIYYQYVTLKKHIIVVIMTLVNSFAKASNNILLLMCINYTLILTHIYDVLILTHIYYVLILTYVNPGFTVG